MGAAHRPVTLTVHAILNQAQTREHQSDPTDSRHRPEDDAAEVNQLGVSEG